MSEKVIKHFGRFMRHSKFFVFNMGAVLTDYIRVLARAFCRFEPSYSGHNWERFLKVQSGDVVVDVGAWPGDFFCSVKGRVSKYVAIEPELGNFTDLSRLMRGYPNAIVLRKAVWNCRCELPFYISDNREAHSLFSDASVGRKTKADGRAVLVEGDTLDNMISDLDLGQVDFLKMDIEGAEIEALEGAKKLLSKLLKIVVASYHFRGGSTTVKRIDELLVRNGFVTWVSTDDLVHGYKPRSLRN